MISGASYARLRRPIVIWRNASLNETLDGVVGWLERSAEQSRDEREEANPRLHSAVVAPARHSPETLVASKL